MLKPPSLLRDTRGAYLSMKDSTTPTQRFLRELVGWLILGAVVLYLAWMAGYLMPPGAESKARPTPTVPCETIAEGIERCGNGLRTSPARPGDSAPRRATATPSPTKGGR